MPIEIVMGVMMCSAFREYTQITERETMLCMRLQMPRFLRGAGKCSR